MGANRIEGCGHEDCSAIDNLQDLDSCFECNVSGNTLSCSCCEDSEPRDRCTLNTSDLYNEDFKTSITLCTDGKTKIKNNNGSLVQIECITYWSWFRNNWMTISIVAIFIIIVIGLVISFLRKEYKKKTLEADKLDQIIKLNKAKSTFGLDIYGNDLKDPNELNEALNKLKKLKKDFPTQYNAAKKLLKDNEIKIPFGRGGGAKRTKRGKRGKGTKGTKGTKAKGGRY